MLNHVVPVRRLDRKKNNVFFYEDTFVVLFTVKYADNLKSDKRAFLVLCSLRNLSHEQTENVCVNININHKFVNRHNLYVLSGKGMVIICDQSIKHPWYGSVFDMSGNLYADHKFLYCK